jgi:hypothetical protein
VVVPHRRKLTQELVQGLATLEVIKQQLYRDACANEHGRPAKDVRIAMHEIASLCQASRVPKAAEG